MIPQASKAISSQPHELKVIGAGWGRTGTTSLKKALEILGYPCYHMLDVVQQRGHSAFWIKVADHEPHDFTDVFVQPGMAYTATTDFPAAQYWQELLAAYPNAKVILTVRDPEEWYRSCDATVFRILPSNQDTPMLFRLAWWMSFTFCWETYRIGKMLEKVMLRDALHGDLQKENAILRFKLSIEEVKLSVPSDQLLVYHIADGWEPLCVFLQKPVPREPFPHLNDVCSFRDMLWTNVLRMFWHKALFAGAFVVPMAYLIGRDFYIMRRR